MSVLYLLGRQFWRLIIHCMEVEIKFHAVFSPRSINVFEEDDEAKWP